MFFIRSFAAMYNYVNESIATLTAYIDTAITNLTTYVDGLVAALYTYVDNKVAAVPQFVKRDNLASKDVDYTTLTRNNTWQELDLSSIIPEGTTLVYLNISSFITLQYDIVAWDNGGTTNHEGNYNVYNISSGNKHETAMVFLVPDTNRKVRYKIKGTNITGTITVRGWYI